MIDVSHRHTSTQQVYRWFAYDHLPPNLAGVSRILHDTAVEMIELLQDGPELTTGLRKLLEAKDCFVRSAVGA